MHRRFALAGDIWENYLLRFHRKGRCIAALQRQTTCNSVFKSNVHVPISADAPAV